MLVLTRRSGESVIIGNGIKLTVVNIGPGRVKIGIEAPPNVRIDREEVHARIQQEQSTDVLAAVSAGIGGEHNTMIVSGSDTGVLSESPPAPAPAANSVPLSKFRAPRKPR